MASECMECVEREAVALEYVHETYHGDIVATLEAEGIDIDTLTPPEPTL